MAVLQTGAASSAPPGADGRRLIVTADDFGLSAAVNAAVVEAHTQGILTAASLMVAGEAAHAAAALAHGLPSLAVGLHVVLVDGKPFLPPDQIPDLVGPDGWFRNDLAKVGASIFFRPRVAAQVAVEVEAQFQAFRATGLKLDHVNAHKHYHLHPTVGRILLAAARRHGATAMRVPVEPASVIRAVDPDADLGLHHVTGPWAKLLRAKVRRAGLAAPDQVLGLAWTGDRHGRPPARRPGPSAPGRDRNLHASVGQRRRARWRPRLPLSRRTGGPAGSGGAAIGGPVPARRLPRPAADPGIGRTRMEKAARLFALLGLILAVVLVAREDTGTLWALLKTGGVGLVIAGLFHAVPMVANARAWQVLLPGAKRPSLGAMARNVWIRESVNGLLPVARIGGEIVSFRILRLDGVRVAPAAASLVVDMAISILSQLGFSLLAVGLLVALKGPVGIAGQVTLGLLAMVPLVALFILVQRAGLFAKVTGVLDKAASGRLAGIMAHSARIDRASKAMYRRTGAITGCFLWQLLGWSLGAGEVWLALWALGHPLGIVEALVIEGLIQAVSSAAFIVPGALGVQEGAFLLLGAALGLDAPTALALAAARRLRDLVVFLPGLVAWTALGKAKAA
ncbi:MAG: hopanoid biosynthesis-associated protein HpnK [Azospirillaceae bacterium]|nr:hopanoid biosynthesis-associated protein HpnK [Azospirillaceae bacterium]